tara:strand:- start:27896 stop:29716 length:1821 start_codon:yes stop_codon:yes gene_type:complete
MSATTQKLSTIGPETADQPIRIVFVNFPPQPYRDLEEILGGDSSNMPIFAIPLGICYLSTNLKSRLGADKVDVRIIDYAKELVCDHGKFATIDEMVRKPALEMGSDFEPDIVGFSMMFSTCHPLFLRAAQELRKIWPNAVFMTGGNHASNSVDVILEAPEIDFVSRGECEVAFAEFVRNFHRRDEFEINGIYSRAHIEAGKATPKADPVDNLDELGFPDWDLLDIEAYVNYRRSATWKKEEHVQREISVLTTRGCPFSCTFCAVHTTMGKRVRYRSVEHVIEEMRTTWERYGTNLYLMEDDLFTANRKKVVPLLQAMRDLGKEIPGFELQFPSALSVNTLFDEVMDELIAAGTKVANIAVESGSEYAQHNIIKKNCNLTRAREVVDYLRERNIITRCYFIGGFPGETREMLDETREYAKTINSDWCTFGVAAPLRGSEMYSQFLERGYINDDMESWSSAFYQERMFDTPEIGAEEIKDFFYGTNIEVNFVNNTNLLDGKFARAKQIFEGIIAGYPYHIFAWHCLMQAHEGLQEHDEARAAREKIVDLIMTNSSAEKLYRKYGHLMPDVTVEGISPDHAMEVSVTDLDTPIMNESDMRVPPIMMNTG